MLALVDRAAVWEHSTEFRENTLWCEEVDLVFKRSLAELQDIYERYSGRYKMPGSSTHPALAVCPASVS